MITFSSLTSFIAVCPLLLPLHLPFPLALLPHHLLQIFLTVFIFTILMIKINCVFVLFLQCYLFFWIGVIVGIKYTAISVAIDVPDVNVSISLYALT